MAEMFPRAPDPDLFPPSVALHSVTIPPDALEARRSADIELPAALERAAAKRKIQFLAGRACARAAIERLTPKVSASALPWDTSGAPVWPEGLVGSISHTETFAAAAVARRSEARGLGVDVEPVMTDEAASDIARLISTEDEARRAALAADLGVRTILTLVFSAKESLFKALFPATRVHFDYLDCQVVSLDPAERRFILRMRAPFDVAFGAAEFAGRYELIDGEVRTGVLIREAGAG